MTTFRPATEHDLAASSYIYYLNEIQGVQNPPPLQPAPPMLHHIFETGLVYVAEQDEQIIGYAGAIKRGQVSFLTDLFVKPETQSGQVGKTLLQYVLPQDGSIRCTVSSTDPRAQALYIRSGMPPQFPHFNLRWSSESSPVHSNASTNSITIVEAQADDPEFLQWDTDICGRERPIDHSFWRQQQQGIPLWFERQGKRVGYGYVRTGTSSFWYSQMCTVGPVGVRSPEYTTDCVLAAIEWATKRANIVRIDVPGPHPCLAPLLERGFRIVYVETFLSAAQMPFFDARCYIPSGSDLF